MCYRRHALSSKATTKAANVTFLDPSVDKLHGRAAFDNGSSLLPAHKQVRADSVPSATSSNAYTGNREKPVSNDALFAQNLCLP